jgi:hypothetical protein
MGNGSRREVGDVDGFVASDRRRGQASCTSFLSSVIVRTGNREQSYRANRTTLGTAGLAIVLAAMGRTQRVSDDAILL